MALTMLSILKVIMIGLGILSAAWGGYEIFSGSGAQTSDGLKKVLGGIAFAILIGITMTWIENEIKKTAGDAGLMSSAYYSESSDVSLNRPELWIA